MAELAVTDLISNKHECNNCFIKFDTLVYLEIIAKFYWFLILQNDRKLMWQKTTASEKSYGIRAVCKLIEMKDLTAKQASLLKKNYNHLERL